MEAIYKMKEGTKEEIKKKMKIKELAEIVGINSCYLSEIVGGRKCSKVIAYGICKCISPDAEILDFFE